MTKFVRIEAPISVSTFFNTKPGSHSFVESNKRPVISTSIYNGTDEDIIIVVPAKTVAYLPGEFLQDRYGQASAKVTKTTISITQPLGLSQPFAKSGKVKAAS